jgi:signal peptidase II
VQERGAVAEVAAAGSRRRRLLVAGAVAVAVVAVDQLTKSLAVSRLADGPVHLFWTLRLNLSFNSGAAFGLGRGSGPVVLVVGVVMLVVLLGVGRMALTHVVAAVALGLLLGGAAGNLFDRLLRDNGGAVIDFIDLQWWPIFNVADMAVTSGAVLLVLVSRDRR